MPTCQQKFKSNTELTAAPLGDTHQDRAPATPQRPAHPVLPSRAAPPGPHSPHHQHQHHPQGPPSPTVTGISAQSRGGPTTADQHQTPRKGTDTGAPAVSHSPPHPHPHPTLSVPDGAQNVQSLATTASGTASVSLSNLDMLRQTVGGLETKVLEFERVSGHAGW